MDGQEYLNQISATNRPEKSSKFSKILTSKYFLIGAIAVVALILIMVVGAALSSGKSNEKEDGYALLLHLNNTGELVNTYQSDVKSSELRASSASLGGVLSETSKQLDEYLTAKYNVKEKDIKKDIVDEANLQKDGLNSELFEAKINGILDRVFAHKMAYEIALISTEESKLIKTTKNDNLRDLLTTSYDSLDNLYNKFNDFSETK